MTLKDIVAEHQARGETVRVLMLLEPPQKGARRLLDLEDPTPLEIHSVLRTGSSHVLLYVTAGENSEFEVDQGEQMSLF